MDKTLKNIYIKLDSGLQSLTKSAKAQIVIKLVYNANKGVSQNEILSLYTAEFKGSMDNETLSLLLDSLVVTGELNKKAKLYTIPRSKKNKIRQNYEESENRKLSIMESFKPFHSSDNIVAEWLEDVTMHFFSMYSENWISDICRERSKAMSSSKESIIQTLERRTASNKKIDARDKSELVNKFTTFISSRTNDVNAFLWEYGTSAFVAKLIANSTGLDTLSLNAFSNSKCILDTNILMHMGLESSEYYHALKSIEKIFLKLNIEVGYFSITKEEYIRTINSKKTEIISSINSGFKENVLKKSNDQYIKTAIHRGCRVIEDYERFFSTLCSLPDSFSENLPVVMYNNDKELYNVIDKAKIDQNKQDYINSLYRNIRNKDKRCNALIHDTAIIAGAEHLRTNTKAFILSQETSINEYAKQKPSVNELPLSIRMETLINILAINNGNSEVESSDYIALFASIIRNGLNPNKDSFKLEDLHYMYEKDSLVSQLPSDEIVRIAKNINRRRLIGEDDDIITKELNREITGAKLKIADDLDETRNLLDIEQKDKKRHIDRADKATNILRRSVKRDLIRSYRWDITKNIIVLLLLLVFMVAVVYMFMRIYKSELQSVNLFLTNVIGLVISITPSIILGIKKVFPKIGNIINKIKEIDSEVEKEISSQIDN